MAFMIPRYFEGELVTMADENGESLVMEPAYAETAADEGWTEQNRESGFWVELSAPGYLDRTGWDGPFESLHEARRHVIDQWEVDPNTGDELPEDLTDEDIEALVEGTYEYDE